MNESNQEMRVLAIHPTHRGFGFVVFEPGQKLIDWGLKQVKQDANSRSIKLFDDLIERYMPDVIVIEDLAAKTTRRGPRVKTLLRRVSMLATRKGIECIQFSRAKIMETFTDHRKNKHQVASSIASKLPELSKLLPKPRKSWTSEDERMSIFGAAALVLAFLFDNRAEATKES